MFNEKYVLECITRLAPSDGVALDIGANHGKYTRLIAEKYKKVYAFEPHPDNARILRQVVADLPNVEVVEKAISAYDEPVRLYVCAPNPGGHSINSLAPQKAVWGHSFDNFVVVDGVTLSTFCRDKDVDFIKCDIEGGEEFIFDNADDVLKISSIKIMLETHMTMDPEKLYQKFTSCGLRFIGDDGTEKRSLERDAHYFIKRWL